MRGIKQARMIDNMKDNANIARPIHVAMTDQPRFWSNTHSISISAYISAANVAPAKKLKWRKLFQLNQHDVKVIGKINTTIISTKPSDEYR